MVQVKINTKKNTVNFYTRLQEIYDFFNEELFSRKLPSCLITIRTNKSTAGYLSQNRWHHSNDSKTHELAINPIFLNGAALVKLFQVIVHEQCHLKQVVDGTACRSGYHDKNWASSMEYIGLIPSNTGKKGGKMTGQKMSEYFEEYGLFHNACIKLLNTGFELDWVDTDFLADKRFSTKLYHRALTTNDVNELLKSDLRFDMDLLSKSYKTKSSVISKQKTKYVCHNCNCSIWGKPSLKILCMDCNLEFEGVKQIV